MTEQRAIPMLAYEDAGRAAEWITKVFGFRETERFHDGVGTVTDVVLDLDGAGFDASYPAAEKPDDLCSEQSDHDENYYGPR